MSSAEMLIQHAKLNIILYVQAKYGLTFYSNRLFATSVSYICEGLGGIGMGSVLNHSFDVCCFRQKRIKA